MTFRVRAAALAAFAGTFGLAGAAHAFVPWTNPNGNGSFFTYAGGGSANGLFGDPTLIGGNTFNFTPQNFIASSVNGVAASVPDTLQVTLTANAGNRFTQIRVDEFGDWGIQGIGQVQASGTETINDLINSRGPAFGPLIFNPLMPINTPGSGTWTGSRVIDLTSIVGPDWTSVTFILTNTLQASSQAGSSAFIRKLVVGGPAITIHVMPTPGATALLAMGGLFAARRRRS